jgi:hypothetical protein
MRQRPSRAFAQGQLLTQPLEKNYLDWLRPALLLKSARPLIIPIPPVESGNPHTDFFLRRITKPKDVPLKKFCLIPQKLTYTHKKQHSLKLLCFS